MLPFSPKTPDINHPEVKKLCERLSPGIACVLLKVESIKGAIENECFQNVQKAIDLHGGEIKYGWKLLESLPNLKLEAEFHAVWINSHGVLHEVSLPPTPETDSVLFLPSDSLSYNGKQVDNIHVPLTDDPLVIDYIEMEKAYYETSNRGDLADFHGYMEPTIEMRAIRFRQQDLLGQIIEKFYK